MYVNFRLQLYIHYMAKSMWTPACPTSHSKIMEMVMHSTLLGRLSTRCWNIAAGTCFHLATSISEVRHWCWAIRPGSHSAFQFIPKVFDGVEVRSLCRSVKFFHSGLNKPFLYIPRFVHNGIVLLKQERAFPKLLPQSWKHIIVLNVIVCCSVKISLHWN